MTAKDGITSTTMPEGAAKRRPKLTPEEVEAVGKCRAAKANSYSQDVNAGRRPRNMPPLEKDGRRR